MVDVSSSSVLPSCRDSFRRSASPTAWHRACACPAASLGTQRENNTRSLEGTTAPLYQRTHQRAIIFCRRSWARGTVPGRLRGCPGLVPGSVTFRATMIVHEGSRCPELDSGSVTFPATGVSPPCRKAQPEISPGWSKRERRERLRSPGILD